MRWKRLIAVSMMVVPILAVPSTAGAAVGLEGAPSAWSSGLELLVETAWNRLTRFVAASEAPVASGTSTDGGPEWIPDGATSEPQGADAPAAEGGPEWDPNGTS